MDRITLVRTYQRYVGKKLMAGIYFVSPEIRPLDFLSSIFCSFGWTS